MTGCRRFPARFAAAASPRSRQGRINLPNDSLAIWPASCRARHARGLYNPPEPIDQSRDREGAVIHGSHRLRLVARLRNWGREKGISPIGGESNASGYRQTGLCTAIHFRGVLARVLAHALARIRTVFPQSYWAWATARARARNWRAKPARPKRQRSLTPQRLAAVRRK